MWLLSFPASWLSDFALEKGVSRATVRKVSNTIAHWGPAVALACMAVIPSDNSSWALVLLIVAVGLNAGSLCGFQINHIDLSPNYAGTMMSITNCIASVIAIIAPLICGKIVVNEVTPRSYISCQIYKLLLRDISLFRAACINGILCSTYLRQFTSWGIWCS